MPKHTQDSLVGLIKDNLDIDANPLAAADAIFEMLPPAAIKVAARAWLVAGVNQLRRDRARQIEETAAQERRDAWAAERRQVAAAEEAERRARSNCTGMFQGQDLSAGVLRDRQKMERCRCAGCLSRIEEFDTLQQQRFAEREAEAVARENAEREWADSFDDTAISWIENPSLIPVEDLRRPSGMGMSDHGWKRAKREWEERLESMPLRRYFGDGSGYDLSRRSERVRDLLNEKIPVGRDGISLALPRMLIAAARAHGIDADTVLGDHHLFSEAMVLGMYEMVERRAGEMVLDLTAELLASEFALGDGVRVTWGEATLEQHRQRATLTTKMAVGNAEDAARHEAAIALLRQSGATRLSEIDRVAA